MGEGQPCVCLAKTGKRSEHIKSCPLHQLCGLSCKPGETPGANMSQNLSGSLAGRDPAVSIGMKQCRYKLEWRCYRTFSHSFRGRARLHGSLDNSIRVTGCLVARDQTIIANAQDKGDVEPWMWEELTFYSTT